MDTIPITVEGIVKPDGTLELNEALNLPPGRVRVTVQSFIGLARPEQDWWQNLQRARAILESRGTGFRTQAEIEAEREDFRSGDDRIDDLYRQIREERRSGPKGC